MGFMSSSGLKAAFELRPSTRFVVSGLLGIVPLVFTSDSHIAWSWCLGWNVCVWTLAFADLSILLKTIEFQVSRKFEAQIPARDVLSIEYSILCSKDLSAEFIDELPASLEVLTGLPDSACELQMGREDKYLVHVKPRQRGNLEWGLLNIIVQSRLGLWQRRLRVNPEGPSTLRVLPRLRNLDAAYLNPRLLLMELGLKPQMRRGDGTEYDRIRDAQVGDPQNRVDWRSTARARKKMVRVYRPEQCDDVVLCIDHGRLMGSSLDDKTTKLDCAIETALYFAALALNVGDRVGMMSFAEEPGPWIKPRRGRKHLGRLVDASYDLESSKHDADHRQALLKIGSHQTKRALVVVLTDFVDIRASAELLSALQILRRRHRVLFVGVSDPFVHQWANAPVESEAQLFRSLAALHMDASRNLLIDEVKGLGIEALDLPPAGLTSGTLNTYLKIRSSGSL